MKKTDPTPIDLIAPCGMNCAVCSRYLSRVHGLKRPHCRGCRPGNKRCSYLFEKCSGVNSSLKGTKAARFCFECSLYPCRQIDRMDARYRGNFGMSVKDNLQCIEKGGLERFIKEQHRTYRCSGCGGFISVHNRKCFACDTVTRLVEKGSKNR